LPGDSFALQVVTAARACVAAALREARASQRGNTSPAREPSAARAEAGAPPIGHCAAFQGISEALRASGREAAGAAFL
jgi:hypothetical protein